MYHKVYIFQCIRMDLFFLILKIILLSVFSFAFGDNNCPKSDDPYSQVCSVDGSDFVAAVVEYYPIQDVNLKPEVRLLDNANAYVSILEEINQKLDIIVYPESTLHANAIINSRSEVLNYTVELQNEYNGVSLCNKEQASFLEVLACAAKTFETYLVVNLIERSACVNEDKQIKQDELRSCSEDGWDFYNTNLVFDRKGAFVSKYRKYNLFGEYYMNQTANPDLSIFETDFGIKFGMFTCFDLLFGTPTLELVKKYGVHHFIFPTMWFSELPFLTGLQAQQQWVHEVDAIFLAAGANDPTVGSGGSGIYQGRSGALTFDIIEKGGSKAYVKTIPNNPSQIIQEDENSIDEIAKKLDDFYFKKDDLNSYTSQLISPKRDVNEILCSNDGDNNKLCCHFNITMELDDTIFKDGKNHYQYRLVAFSSVRSFSGVYNGGVEICGIVACVSDTIDTCTYRFKNYADVSWPVTFKDISIKANFTVEEHKIQHPNSLLSSIRPLPVDAMEWVNTYFSDNNIIERSYKLKKPQNRLMTFAIYGRDFSRDGFPLPEDDGSGTNGLNILQTQLCALLIIVVLLL